MLIASEKDSAWCQHVTYAFVSHKWCYHHRHKRYSKSNFRVWNK